MLDGTPSADRQRRERSQSTRWDLPDLVIIDGGKGQLGAAVEVMRELGVYEIPTVGLAKRFEELFVPDEAEPVVLPRGSEALYLVQRIRDEAHRFAITSTARSAARAPSRARSTPSPASARSERRLAAQVRQREGDSRGARGGDREHRRVHRALAEKVKEGI